MTRKLAFGALLAFTLLLPATASAAGPGLLFQSPANGLSGSASGKLAEPIGVAASPTTGHVYVADSANNRVSEFDAWGQFVKAWGWGVADGQLELQVCGPGAVPPTASCREGLLGSGVGQFNGVRGGIVVDSQGNVWVGDLGNHRVQKFDPEGNFLLMIGGGVDQGPNHPGNLCTAGFLSEGDICGAGSAGSGGGEFATDLSVGNAIAVKAGAVYVGDVGRVQEFSLAGAVNAQITLEAPHATQVIKAIAARPTGRLYLSLGSGPASVAEGPILEVNAAGQDVGSIPVPVKWAATGLALDGSENLYVALTEVENLGGIGKNREVVEYGPAGEPLIPFGDGFAKQANLPAYEGLAVNTVTAGGAVDVYLTASQGSDEKAALRSYGPPPDKWPPPQAPPEVVSQYSASVGETSAVIAAEINPRFWADTTYSFEYGIGKCSEGGCPGVQPIPPASLGGGIIGIPVATAGIELTGLTANTVYHFRVTAQSSGGGPVKGVGPGEAEGTFATALPFSLNSSCPNQAFRFGEAAKLADCRGYEMVSPIDKNGADIYPLINVQNNPVALDQSTPDGAKLAYTDFQAFADAQGAPYVSQYVASRAAGGWETHDITAPQGVSILPPGKRIDLNVWQLTPDLCAATLMHFTDPAIAPGAVPGFRNSYLRQNCGPESYQALTTTVPPAETDHELYVPAPEGMSDDGRCVVVGLLGAGNNAHNGSIYNWCAGQQLPVSVLPDGTEAVKAVVGTRNGLDDSLVLPRIGNVKDAVSSDGTRIYWSAEVAEKRRLFVRINADQEQSPLNGTNCTQKAKACTKTVSQTVSNGSAQFLAASSDGAIAYFTISDNSSPLVDKVFEFNLAAGKSTEIAGEYIGALGASSDGSRFVFASREVLTSASNSAGRSAVAGEANLYYYDASRSGEDRFRFVGTLTAKEAVVENQFGNLTPIASEPFRQISRITSEGTHVVFASSADLTGYDNRDLISGEPDAEVYLFDANAGGGAGRLTCVSCNPSGQRPTGRQVEIELLPTKWSAALIPPYQTEFYGSRAVSEDGNRVYFDSYGPLVGGDTNGKADVYQWEAPGSGDCIVGGSGYSASNDGCISLISSGTSPADSNFLDASTSGSDVFFATAQSLVPQDPGQYDIYDAREGGGFPLPPAPPAACQGDSCQSGQGPPATSAPGTTAQGKGNPKKPKPTCTKNRRAVKKHGKWRCVKKKQKHHGKKKQKHHGKKSGGKKKGGKNRRAGR